MGAELGFDAAAFVAREAALFAAVGFLVLGASDLLVDLIWIGRTLRNRIARRGPRFTAEDLPPPETPGFLAVFVPAWDEAGVIEDMLTAALERFAHPDYRIYVGCYPNDPATIASVAAIVDPRVRLVLCPADGPTTKADCLNALWDAMCWDEAREGRRAKAIVLHDAEDVVHPAELRLFDALIGRFDLVQLPVRPMIDAGSRWIAGHYIDEFAEAHGKEMVVREALGAALPSAGVGCAFSRTMLARIAALHGRPFDPHCLTEDYELGLRLRAEGGKGIFVRLPAGAGRGMIVTREYFPATIDAAVAQKARWMTGIALAGWDRLGWSGGIAERWMRLRDRQSVLAAGLLVAGYLALALFVPLWIADGLGAYRAPPLPPILTLLMQIGLVLLAWRLAMRFGFVAHAYGLREGLRAIPRVLISNMIAMLAAHRALGAYARIRRTGRVHWAKTRHAFPVELPAE